MLHLRFHHHTYLGVRETGSRPAVLMEQNDEWQTQNRYMQIEGMAEMMTLALEARPLQITPKAA